VTKKVYILVSR